MNQEKFQQELNRELTKLPIDERHEILQDYEEYFANGLLDGKTEEQIIASLGSPKNIGKDLSATYHLEKAEKTATTGNIMRAMWAIIGLSFFNLLIVFAPFLSLVTLLLAGWIASIGSIVAPLLVLVSISIYPGTFELFDLFSSLAFCGLGLFIAIGMLFATKAVMNGFIRYMKFNTKLVKGGLKHAEH